MGFFDAYPEFYNHRTISHANRLNNRYVAIIESNRDIIRGARILDIGAFDGRWSFAALKSGAAHSTLMEARAESAALSCMERYGIDSSRYRWVVGDVHETIRALPPKVVDVVFCLGFFYHTHSHFQVLSEIQRLAPSHLILDTEVWGPKRGKWAQETPAVLLRFEPTQHPATGYAPGRTSLVGVPTVGAVERMLDYFGYTYRYYDWHTAGIADWSHIEDYRKGTRVTLVAEPR